MVGLIGGRSSAFDYIGPDLPSNPQNGEMWFDTDGGSDGTGEVKVYDGANGAWEATGFTSHADLTDVTRGAHHPPVSVNGPLTQPSDQTLGLSIGNGLANSAGTLVAALGNGLGIDANGQVYVPAGALAHGAEVDTPADAHHTRYSDSEARTAVESGVARVGGGNGFYLDFNNSTNWAELVDGGGGRAQLVTEDVYVNEHTQWLGAHIGDANAHHSRPSSTNGGQFGSSTSTTWMNSYTGYAQTATDAGGENVGFMAPKKVESVSVTAESWNLDGGTDVECRIQTPGGDTITGWKWFGSQGSTVSWNLGRKNQRVTGTLIARCRTNADNYGGNITLSASAGGPKVVHSI